MTYKLSMYQVVTTTCTSFLPLMFWIFPRYAAYDAGVDGQWAVLGACLIALFSALVHGFLSARFPRVTGVEMNNFIYGKYLGKTITTLFVPGYLLFLATSVYSFSISVKSLLPNTPRLATVLAMIVVACMAAIYGLETISRVSSVVFPTTIIVLGLSFIFVYFQGDWTGLFVHPVNLPRVMSVSAELLTTFFGLNMYIMLSPYFDHRMRNAIWLPIFSVGFGSILILFVFLCTIRVVGYEGVRALAHPVDFVLQLVQVQGLLIQRFGVVLVFISTMFEVVFLANHLWALSELSRRVLDINSSSEKWFAMSYALIITVAFQVIPNQQVADSLVLRVLVPLSWAYLVIEPFVALLLSYIRGKQLQRVQAART